MKETVEKISKEFFEKLLIDMQEISIEEDAPHIFSIKLKTDDSHLLIGPHGKNLETMTNILRLLIGKQLWENIILHLEVNDYLQKKDEKLFSYIESKIQIVEKTGSDFRLPFFTAYERKKVHSYVSEKGGRIYTKSMGEGEERRIFLCKKDAKMTIDIDGDDI